MIRKISVFSKNVYFLFNVLFTDVGMCQRSLGGICGFV